MAATAARLALSPPGICTSTWLSTTSLRTFAPGIAANRWAIRLACAQLRSIISATPARPSDRMIVAWAWWPHRIRTEAARR
jgi:hypothetical protein